MTTSANQRSLNMLTNSVWRANGNDEACPQQKYPTFRQLDDLITTTAWGSEAREEFFQRWKIVERASDKSFEVASFAELAHLVWEEASTNTPGLNPNPPMDGVRTAEGG